MTRTEPARSPVEEGSPESAFRRRLLDGMAVAVRENGYAEATVADIVRYARTSRRTFYEHFSSKQDCFVALMTERNTEMIAHIAAAVDAAAPWRTQVRQAIEAWIGASREDPWITLSWIRDSPALGELARQLHRGAAEAFIVLIQNLASSTAFESSGLHRPSREMATIVFGGFRELIAITVEDGGDIETLVDVTVEAAIALLGANADPPASI
ncbi:TetR/AcrR family transcriptional regulator [Nocardia albiluteola]|nr:TetR/AcrR family transcriptional regulator [Nocardia albiluteola]